MTKMIIKKFSILVASFVVALFCFSSTNIFNNNHEEHLSVTNDTKDEPNIVKNSSYNTSNTINDEHNSHSRWTEVAADTGTITGGVDFEDAARYYLKNDIELSTDLTIKDGYVILCLNGFMLTGTGTSSVITVEEGDTGLTTNFYLCDCSASLGNQTTRYFSIDETTGKYTYCGTVDDCGNNHEHASVSGGVITGGVGGRTVIIYSSGYASTAVLEYRGGGINLYGDVVFTMYEGNIVGNGNSSTSAGGGLGIYEGSAVIEGGSIQGNIASTSGAGVCVELGSLTISDGVSISNNLIYNTSNSGSGGGVYVYRATFTMEGGEIMNNFAASSGGVAITSSSTGYIRGGIISNNRAINSAGGISRATSTTSSSTTLYMSGNPIIKDNYLSATDTDNDEEKTTSNLYLRDGAYINVDGAFTDGAEIGITLGGSDTETIITSGYSSYNTNTYPSDYFFGDNGVECVYYSSGEVYIGSFHYFHVADVKYPTDEEGGYITIRCLNGCGLNTTIEFDPIGVLDPDNLPPGYTTEGYEPTCTESGLISYYYDYLGGRFWIYETEIPALGHDYSSGTYYYDDTHHYECCIRCDVYNSEGEEHSKTSEVLKAPTESEEGQLKIYCITCEWYKTVVLDPLDEVDPNSNPQYYVETTYPTCTEYGSYDYYYIDGDERYLFYQESFGEPLGHEYSSGSYDYDDTYHYEYCIRCEATNDVGDAHTKVGELINLPNENEQGRVKISCEVCERSETIEFNLNDTNYRVSTTNPTCTEEGQIDYYYNYENEWVWIGQESIDALGHNYTRGEYYSDENGHYEYCIRCDATGELEVHDFDDVWVPSQEDGMEERNCNTCGYTQTRAAEEEPVDPEDPENPSEPTDPDDPSDPDDPDNPGVSTDPGDSEDPTDTGNPNDPTDTGQGGETPGTGSIDSTTSTVFILHGVYIGIAVICLIAGYIAKRNAEKDSEIPETKTK